jgi:Uncharacterised protein conserved in bacteria (DUF2336)
MQVRLRKFARRAVYSKYRSDEVLHSFSQSVPEIVVDVLVQRGNGEVLRILADNCGAKLSENAFAQLIDRCGKDDTPANSVGSRPDVPHHRFQQLLACLWCSAVASLSR